jgi:putative pyrroloquinoline-quinone binding quinoprotein
MEVGREIESAVVEPALPILRVTTMNRVDFQFPAITWTSAVLFGLLCPIGLRADDWPQWRGPNRDGVYSETGLLESFPAEGLKVRWRVPVGWGFSSPVVAQGRVFVTDAGLENPNVREQILCFDEATGESLWTYSHQAVYPDWEFVPGQEQGPNATPIVITSGGSRQLIVWTLNSVTALDPATGKTYWREKFNAGGSASVVSTPVFSDNRLLVNGLMLKLDAEKPSASVLWPDRPARRFLASTSTALLRGDYLYCGESSGELVCREASTGKEVWQTDKATDSKYGARTSIHLTMNGNSVLLFNDQGELIRARLTAEGYHEISRVALIEPTYPSSGRKVAWSSPAYANRHVFARSDKELKCASLAANPE